MRHTSGITHLKMDTHMHKLTQNRAYFPLALSLTLLRSVPYLRLSSSRVSLWSSCKDTKKRRISPVFMSVHIVCISTVRVFKMPKTSNIYGTLCADLSALKHYLSQGGTSTMKHLQFGEKNEWMTSQQKTQWGGKTKAKNRGEGRKRGKW